MKTTYLNSLNNFKIESIPAEIVAVAEARVAWDNDPSNGYRRGINTELISIQPGNVKTELQPNSKNIDTADTVKIRNWSYTVLVTDKVFKNGNKKQHEETYFLYRETIEVLEVGGYYNPNNQ